MRMIRADKHLIVRTRNSCCFLTTNCGLLKGELGFEKIYNMNTALTYILLLYIYIALLVATEDGFASCFKITYV